MSKSCRWRRSRRKWSRDGSGSVVRGSSFVSREPRASAASAIARGSRLNKEGNGTAVGSVLVFHDADVENGLQALDRLTGMLEDLLDHATNRAANLVHA